MLKVVTFAAVMVWTSTLALAATTAPAPVTTTGATTARASAFFPAELLHRVRANVERDDWGRTARKQAIELAEPWRAMSDDQLWESMFGATIPRSWMVWSNGFCPACKKPVPMYDWQIDAMARPWKVRCPHCQELFPKNDFKRFYDSGLDAHGVFDPAKGDRSLLFNTDHPDASDPLHHFGVDDGTGYTEGAHRWRFIGTYLVYGQWKQAVLLGVTRLTTAYVVSGDPIYAHKAAVLLDRVADLYPTFDFRSQAFVYEIPQADGYVSTWHDATLETRAMAMAYDAIKDVIAHDQALMKFIAAKSEKYQTPRRKRTADDIAANIEERILRDALAHPQKIYSNFPQQQLTTAVIQTALGWPANREQVLATLDPVIEQSTAFDGTTGEKGLANYSAYAAQRLAEFLGYYARMDDRFLPEMMQRHPRLPMMYRFFIDTWCANGKNYPLVGDTGWFAGRLTDYAGVTFSKDHSLGAAAGASLGVLTPSAWTLLWQLHQATHDPAFAQILWRANEANADKLPYDLSFDDPPAMQRELKQIIETHGPDVHQVSVNKEQWHLAILRSGQGAAERDLWMSYDAGGNHGHRNGLNLGLFAHGLDLMPDFGYPPVQFGGWDSPRAHWYESTQAHNLAIIDGKEQDAGQAGQTTLWASGEHGFNAIAVSAPALYASAGATKYERTIALVDTSDRDSYAFDVFRVAGGSDHFKYFLSHFGTVEPSAGLMTEPAKDFVHDDMRNLKVARQPAPGWSMTWNIDDHYKYLPPEQAKDVHLRYTDFTSGADAYLGEAWVVAGIYNSTAETWVPRVVVRRKGPKLASTFVSLVEPYQGAALIRKSTRVPMDATGGAVADSCVGLEVELADGRRDLLISNDSGGVVTAAGGGASTDAALCMVRRSPEQRPAMIAVCKGRRLEMKDVKLQIAPGAAFVQIGLNANGSASLLAGTAKDIEQLEVDGKAVVPR